jgi:TetR/AcrR family transcriptional repressor of nem operon
VIGGHLDREWLAPLRSSEDPATVLSRILAGYIGGNAPLIELEHGCPLNNLTQELANTDEAFRSRLMRVHESWSSGIAKAIERGQAAGTVRRDIDPSATATFVICTIEGLAGTAKSTRSLPLVLAAGGVLMQFLETLRPEPTVVAPSRAARRKRPS